MENFKQEDIKDLQKIKQVLIQVSKNVYRDLKFFYQADNKEQRRKIYNKEIEYSPDNSYAIVCKTLCNIVKDICVKEYNLNVELINCDTDEFGHKDILFTAKSGHKYIINCLSDLERIQLGMKANRFAKEKYFGERYGNILNKDEFCFLSDEEEKQIDENIGYFQYMYMDDFFRLLRSEFDNLKNTLKEDETLRKMLLGEDVKKEDINNITFEQLINTKVQFLLDFCNKRKNIIGHIELVRIYKLLSKLLFTKEELKTIQTADCFFDKKENTPKEEIWNTGEERTRFLRLKIEDDVYILTTKDNTYLQMTSQEYEKFKQENDVYEKDLSNISGVISESIRNKGIGVNILKHKNVWKRLKDLDDIANNINPEELDKIEKQIQESSSDNITFELEGKTITIKLDEAQVDIDVNEEHSSYKFENDELIEMTDKGNFRHHYEDEGKYTIERI